MEWVEILWLGIQRNGFAKHSRASYRDSRESGRVNQENGIYVGNSWDMGNSISKGVPAETKLAERTSVDPVCIPCWFGGGHKSGLII